MLFLLSKQKGTDYTECNPCLSFIYPLQSYFLMNLFLELRRHGKLAEKRHPMYEKSKFGKFWMYLMAIGWACYLMFFGTMFAFAFDEGSREAYHVMNAGLVIVLVLDFLIRLPFQKTPTQEVKPYMLLPVRRNKLIDFLLIRSGLNSFNLMWLFMFVPFAILTITKFYGIAGVLTYCIGIWLLMVLNNYWFLLCRTLMGERIWWLLLPTAIYGGIIAWLFVPDESPLFDFSVNLGEGFIYGNPLTFLGVLAAIALMWLINRRIIRGLVYNELNKVEDTRVKHVSEYKFLDRYGEIGEFMRLELKMILRNKICKSSLFSVIGVVLFFSVAICFDLYERSAAKDFLVIYNYTIFGLLFLANIMSYEGNYIDGLMSRKESIYTLLRAKYTLYSLGCLLPFLLMTPALILGKVSIMTCLTWLIFVPGAVYFFLFQLAVFNNKTTDLNTKMTNRQNMGTGIQNLISFAALGVPLILNFSLKAIFGQDIAYWILIAVGLGFILTSRYWLMNVYKRFMKRRYKNMEGFRDSRQRA